MLPEEAYRQVLRYLRSDGTYGAPSHLERPDGYGHPYRQEARCRSDA